MEKPYIKEFDKWNVYLKALDSKKSFGFFHEREVWWCALGVNVGSEQDGKNELFERPVLIIKKIRADLFLGIPLTSKLASYPDRIFAHIAGEDSQIIISQLRVLSSKRLLRKVGRIKIALFQQVLLELIQFILQSTSETPLEGGESQGPYGQGDCSVSK
jgi:mRNA interferase MazF